MSAYVNLPFKALSLLSVLLLAMPSVGSAQESSATVTGRVLDQMGAAVPHVEVRAIREGRTIGSAATDGDGRYRLTIDPGTVQVRMDRAMGWMPSESRSVSVGAGETVTLDLETEIKIYDQDEIVVVVGGAGSRTTSGEALGWVGRVHEEEIGREVTVNPVDDLRGQPGADLVDTGIGGRVLTFRGFNNIFSGALRYLVDYRQASLPSLRANFTHFVPTTTSDIGHMELVLGPSSALYGPNAADGVLNVVTRSPLGLPETHLSVAGGSQSVAQGSFRTSQRLGSRVGLKVSTRWLQASEYPYADPVEEDIRELVDNEPETFRNRLRDVGVPEDEIATREQRVGIRDLDIERWSVDARLDWAPSEGDTVSVQAGRMNTTGVEVTPLGAAQAGGWEYDYLQGRFQSGSLFGQAYINTSDAGDSYLLRDGAPLVDGSRLIGTQLRYAFDFADGREEITVGADWARTNPRTGGTIHGQFEGDDAIVEYGGYLQSRTRLSDALQLVGTLRVDESNVIEDPVLSPRVGLVFEPSDGQTLSASWSRGFSTPTPTNYFLDLSAGTAPGSLGAVGYRIRARGTGREGIRFLDGQGGFQGMRSPCTPPAMGGASQLVPISEALMWQCGIGILQGQGAVDTGTAAFLRTLDPTGAITVNAFDPITGDLQPLTTDAVDDVAPLTENTTTTFEMGYRGMLGDRVFVQTAIWRTEKENFVSPLTIRTPLLTLDGPEMVAFLVANGVPAADAQALAQGMAPIPLAVLSSGDVQAEGAELITTYENFGAISYWGVDIGAEARLTRSFALTGTASIVSDDHFDIDGRLVPLNAPEFKGTLALQVDNLSTPVEGEVRMRHHSGFPVVSGDYIGTRCMMDTGSDLVEDCVEASTLFDATVRYDLVRDLGLTVSVTNLLGTDYRPFVGVPTTGRRILARLDYRLR